MFKTTRAILVTLKIVYLAIAVGSFLSYANFARADITPNTPCQNRSGTAIANGFSGDFGQTKKICVDNNTIGSSQINDSSKGTTHRVINVIDLNGSLEKPYGNIDFQKLLNLVYSTQNAAAPLGIGSILIDNNQPLPIGKTSESPGVVKNGGPSGNPGQENQNGGFLGGSGEPLGIQSTGSGGPLGGLINLLGSGKGNANGGLLNSIDSSGISGLGGNSGQTNPTNINLGNTKGGVLRGSGEPLGIQSSWSGTPLGLLASLIGSGPENIKGGLVNTVGSGGIGGPSNNLAAASPTGLNGGIQNSGFSGWPNVNPGLTNPTNLNIGKQYVEFPPLLSSGASANQQGGGGYLGQPISPSGGPFNMIGGSQNVGFPSNVRPSSGITGIMNWMTSGGYQFAINILNSLLMPFLKFMSSITNDYINPKLINDMTSGVLGLP